MGCSLRHKYIFFLLKQAKERKALLKKKIHLPVLCSENTNIIIIQYYRTKKSNYTQKYLTCGT